MQYQVLILIQKIIKMEGEEIWKDVIGFPFYYVSNLGNVKSSKRNKVRILKAFPNGRGYLTVPLYHNKKTHSKRVHILVAQSFLNHVNNGKTDISVDHIDNDKTNNKLDNLQLITHTQNIAKQVKNKLGVTGVRQSAKGNKFYAQISKNGRYVHLGNFNTIQQAKDAYDNQVKIYALCQNL